jgi:HAD superfamily hydrolase (TIGR01549 family)
MDGTLLEPVMHTALHEYKVRWEIAHDHLIVPHLPRLPQAATDELIALEAEIAASGVLRKDAARVLHVLKTRGVRTALVTNNSRISAATFLKLHDLEFDFVVSRDEAPQKPAPQMLFKALEHLSVRPEHAVMIGDTEPDLVAASAAKLAQCFILHEPYNAHLMGTVLTRVSGGMPALFDHFLERIGNAFEPTARI